MISWSETERPRSTTSSSGRMWVPLLKERGICPLLAFPFYPLSFQYHHSFTAVDPCLGPLVVSVCLEEEENRLRVILRFHLFHLWCTSKFTTTDHESRIMWSCVRRDGGGEAPLLTSELSLTGAFTGAIWLYGSWFGRQSLSNKCDVEKKIPLRQSKALYLFYRFGHSVGIGGCININMCFQVKYTSRLNVHVVTVRVSHVTGWRRVPCTDFSPSLFSPTSHLPLN